MSNKNIFEPWNNEEIISREGGADISDIVKEPPCATCKFWEPTTEHEEPNEDRGINLCTKNGSMVSDFSCYRHDKNKIKQNEYLIKELEEARKQVENSFTSFSIMKSTQAKCEAELSRIREELANSENNASHLSALLDEISDEKVQLEEDYQAIKLALKAVL